MAAEDYPYMRAWWHIMACSESYAEREVRRAQRMNAPPNAIYEKYGDNGNRSGEWAVYEDITSPRAKARLDAAVEDYKK